MGTSSVDARHQRCRFTDLLHPAIPRHPESPVGLLASASDLVPGLRWASLPSGSGFRQPGSLGGEVSTLTGGTPMARLRRPRTSGLHYRRFENNRARQLPP